MSGDLIVALIGVGGTLLTAAGGGTFALIKWLVGTLNAAYKAQVDVTLTAKNIELDLLRDDNTRVRAERDWWQAEAERLRDRGHG